VFITVSAGQSNVQLQMESVAAIVPSQPNKSRAKAPIVQRDPQFGSQTSAPQSTPELLFSVPQGDPSNEPVADSHVTTSPETADDASSDHGGSATSNPAVNEQAASAPRPRSKPPKAKVPKKASRLESHTAPASSKWSPEDKRSCRALAGDGPLF
jgi:hypothetical protein